MRAYAYADMPTHPLVFLVPSIKKQEIQKEYLDSMGIPTDDVVLVALHLTGKKTPVGEMKQWLNDVLVPALNEDKGVKYLIVADGGYYKALTGYSGTASYGYVRDCIFGPWKVVYVPNVRSVFYDPEKTRAKIVQSLDALKTHIAGTYKDPGDGIIQFSEFSLTYGEIEVWLEKLLEMDCDLTIDIEAFSLKHYKAGIGTISFAWNKHEGIAFPVDYESIPGAETAPFGRQVLNKPVRALLKKFFQRFKRKAIYHNIAFDVYDMIYQLFMEHVLDTEGLLEGLEVMLGNWDDTQLITYLATNSCAGNKLGLKDNSQEYSGNYAIEVEDITTQPLPELLRYNLIDSLSTWFVKEKNEPKMIADNQQDLYESLFKHTIRDLIQIQLTGLPIYMPRVKQVKAILEADEASAVSRLRSSKTVQQFTYRLKEKWVVKKNATLKKKRVTLADAKEEFNPNSNPQLQDLLYGMLGLPVIDETESGAPATGAETLEKLVNHTQDPDVKDFLRAMEDYSAVNKILTSFIPAMELAVEGPDGWHYLIGSFRLGGTVSGRLSSKDPNLQNLPANSKYAKLIKSCFQAPPGWLLCGLDFASLEDRISALTTKDPNKLAVYQGHLVFEVTVDGVTHQVREDTIIVFDGKTMTAKEFYETHRTI